MALTIVATIGVLAVLILVHEWGHFVAARWFGIRVSRFSIGLGPKLFGFRRGETEFRLSALPLGGYVKVAGLKEMDALEGGDDDEATLDPGRRFDAKPAAVRAAVLSAGVFMNAVLAVVLFAVVAVVWGTPVPPDAVVGDVVEEWLPEEAAALASLEPGARVIRVGDRAVADMDQVARAIMAAHAGPLTFHFADREPLTIQVPEKARDRQFLPLALDPVGSADPVVGRLSDDGAAARAGLRPGDRVRAIDGAPIATWQELSRAVERSPRRPLALDVERAEGGTERVVVTPEAKLFGGREIGRIGAAAAPSAAREEVREKRGVISGMAWGARQSWDMVTLMGQFVAGLFDGRHSPRELGGPVLIGQLSGAAARAGFPTLLMFAALLSMNLAVINLLPIPALDGGHLALLGIETVRGKPIGDATRMALGRVGVTVVAALMVWALAADILRITGA